MKNFFKDRRDADIFKDVAFIVEANNNEVMNLWLDNHYKPRDGYKSIPWEQVMQGVHVTIGSLKVLGEDSFNEYPVAVSVQYAIVHGKRVMFYYGVSQVVDHEMIEAWWHHNAPGIGHCDAMNFHNCLLRLTGKR